MMQLADVNGSDTVAGRLLAVRDDGSVVDTRMDASSETAAPDSSLRGTVTPGYVGGAPQAVDAIVIGVDEALETTTCRPAQEARFLGG